MPTSQLPIDPAESLRILDRKRAELKDPAHQQMIDVFQEHMRAELDKDLERIMRTLVPEPEYHLWGNSEMPHFSGQAATRAFYTAIFESGTNQLERTFDRFIIDDYGIFFDGHNKVVIPGPVAGSLARFAPDVELEESGTYLLIQRTAVILPYRDGLMVGEDFYDDNEDVQVLRID